MSDDSLLEVRVKEAEIVSADVLVLTLVPIDRDVLPAWEPGAHVDLYLPSGLMRSYSLCGDPDDLSHYRIAVLRVYEGRGGSNEIHEIDWVGARTAETHRSLHISVPRNQFALVESPRYLFVAGGIGITPLLPMVRHVAAQGTSWRLVYGGRTRATMAFVPELEAAIGGEMDLVPQDVDGLIDVPALFDELPQDCEVYACGPGPMLTAIQDEARRIGTADRLHVERFSATPVAEPTGANKAFDVELRLSGKTIRVGADETILAKVLEVIPSHPWSCQEGICGSCETTVLDGDVDHRDEILDDAEREANESMFICVSRCRGPRLVLDL